MENSNLTTIKFENPDMTTGEIVSNTVEVEILAPNDEIEIRLAEIQDQLCVLDEDIDKLTSHTDNLDRIVAVASGVIAGLIDIFFVGKFNLQEGREWSSEKINEFVKNIAKSQGYEGKDLEGSISFLERFGAPSDSVYNQLGGARQHHLRDFAHHASPIGLAFSMLTQFTKKAYGTDTTGLFIVVPIDDLTFIGDTLPTKITFGLVYWMLHMASDMAGSSGAPGGGTGIPGPILSTVKLLSSFPIFHQEDQVNELSKTISKLFNGTLLAERDDAGKIARGLDGKPLIKQMDLRGELGVAHQLGKQALPIIVNEALVRGFYFINRFVDELRVHQRLKDVDWSKTVPIGNRTIERMMTISLGVFSAIDLLDAVIKGTINSGGNWVGFGKELVLRLNFVGIGRFTVALGTEAVMGFRKHKKNKQRMLLKNETLYLMNVKIYQGEALIWQATKDANESIDAFYDAMGRIVPTMSSDLNDMKQSAIEITAVDTDKIAEKNPGLLADILDEL